MIRGRLANFIHVLSWEKNPFSVMQIFCSVQGAAERTVTCAIEIGAFKESTIVSQHHLSGRRVIINAVSTFPANEKVRL